MAAGMASLEVHVEIKCKADQMDLQMNPQMKRSQTTTSGSFLGFLKLPGVST